MEPTPEKRTPAPDGRGNLWTILLAAGDGKRIHGLATDVRGRIAPKQYCTFDGRASMLRWAVRRASGMVPKHRVVVVVAGKHWRWWARDLSDLPLENIVVQPSNRGTAAGILLPLFHVLKHDPRARVLILPSDHYVRDERRLRGFMIRAVEGVEGHQGRILLLGMVPEGPDGGYGWIIPVSAAELARVETFVEKPGREAAGSLIRRGALLNSFIIAARAETLLHACLRAVPSLVREFVRWRDDSEDRWSDLVGLYDAVPSCDFSRDVLERSSGRLLAVRVSDCGWTDLGTRARLQDYRQRQHRDALGHGVTPGRRFEATYR